MKKLLVIGALLAAAGYVFTQYFAGGGASMTKDSGVANQVLEAAGK